MSDDRGGGPAGGAPQGDPDIRAALAAAFAEDAKRSDGAPAPEPAANGADPAAAPNGAGAPAAAAEPQPGEPRPGEPAPAEPGAPPPAEPAPGEPAKPGEDEPAAPAGADEAPRHWSVADRDVFTRLPAEAKAPFMQLYRRMERGFSDRLERGAQLDRDYGVLDQTVFTPQIRAEMAQGNYTIRGLVESWAKAETTLSNHTNQPAKDAFLAELICYYRGDTNQIARYIHEINERKRGQGGGGAPGTRINGGPQGGAPQGGNGGVPTLDPTQLSPELVNYLTSIANEVGQLKQDHQIRVQNEGMAILAAFAEERDAAGELLHPDIERLHPIILELANIEKAAGRQPNIHKIYNEALWRDPSTREQQLQRRDAAAAQRAAGEARARADQARRAASSISGAPGGSGGTSAIPPEELSIRDNIVKGLTADRRVAGGRGRI